LLSDAACPVILADRMLARPLQSPRLFELDESLQCPVLDEGSAA